MKFDFKKILFNFLLIIFLNLNQIKGIKFEWIESKNLNEWYQPWEICVLEDKVENSPIDLMYKCKEKYGNDSDINSINYRCRVGGERFQYTCALDGPPQTSSYFERPYLKKSLKLYDNPTKYYLKDFMLQLKKLNGNLLIFGDSQVQSLCRSMTCELDRTHNSPDPPQERPTGAIFENNITIPIQCLNHNNLVDIDNDIGFIHYTIKQSFHKFNYTFVIVNVGTHYNEVADQVHQWKNSHIHFKQHLLKLFPVLKALQDQYPYPPLPPPLSQSSAHISWLETPPQHYSTYNGYFNGTLTKCQPIQNTSSILDWRNYDVYSTLSFLNITSIPIIRLRDYMIPLYREHHRGDDIDCTHYCYWPMLYQIVYKRMLDILLKHTLPNYHRQSHSNINNHNN